MTELPRDFWENSEYYTILKQLEMWGEYADKVGLDHLQEKMGMVLRDDLQRTRNQMKDLKKRIEELEKILKSVSDDRGEIFVG